MKVFCPKSQKAVIFITFLLLIILTSVSNAAEKIISTGFEDLNGNAETSPNYPFSTSHWNTHINSTEVVKGSCGGVSPHKGSYYFHQQHWSGIDAGDDPCLGQTDDVTSVNPHTLINVGSMNEIFLHFYFQANAEYGRTAGGNRLKWIELIGNTAIDGWAHFSSDGGIHMHEETSTSWGPKVPWPSGNPFGDGKWHSFAMYVNINTGQQSIWLDTTDWGNPTETRWYSFGGTTAFNYVVLSENFSSDHPSSSCWVNFDDIEIWDGIPSQNGGGGSGDGSGDNTTPPGDVVGFTAQPGNGQVDLSWTNPADNDFAGTMVRYRTDGQYPTDYNDGTELCNKTGTPGLSDSYRHENAQNGTTYFYSAFTYDTAGNYSQTAHTDATPIAEGGGGLITMTFGDTPEANYPGTIQDTFINTDTNVYGSNSVLSTYTWPNNRVANAILMKMDLSQIPADAQIQSAKLELNQTRSGGDVSYDLSVHKVINNNPNLSSSTGYTYDGTNEWTANNENPNGAPLAQADISSAESTVRLDTTAGYKTWNITNMVRDWVANPSSNYGLLINSDAVASANSYRYFASSEAADANQRPKVVVVYSVDTLGREPSAPNWK